MDDEAFYVVRQLAKTEDSIEGSVLCVAKKFSHRLSLGDFIKKNIMFNLKHLLHKDNRYVFLASIGFGIGAGLLNFLIILIITHAYHLIKDDGYGVFVIAFVGSVLIYVLTNYFSLSASAKLTNQLILQLRLKIQRYVLSVDYHEIEQKGLPSLYAINNDDIAKVEQYAQIIPRMLMNVFIILILVLYMTIVNPITMMVFLALTIIFGMSFHFFQRKIQKQHQQSRIHIDKIAGNTNDLLEGIRELKVNPILRERFFSQGSRPILSDYHRQQTLTSKFDQLLISYFWVIYYTILFVGIGLLVYQHNPHPLAFILPLMMLFGPVTMMVANVTIIYAAKIAIQKIMGLESKQHESLNVTLAPPITFNSLKIQNLEYIYTHQADNSSFKVGPISFELNRGEIIFIIGGNGSGKSTLIKLLTGLYQPHSGCLDLNGNKIENSNKNNYQNMLSVIYQKPHIFNQILTIGIEQQQSLYQQYLKLFELEYKIEIKNNIFQNLEQLSYGQKKRLGLLVALMEDKPIYIFDEWAADQDPHFRKIFYTIILAKLKASGKTVIAVTHDETYFHLADTIIALIEGRQQ